uniref:non-specific serine/threonine protein kinase n=1 Tax=Chelydra serpentina TaxID=8475 RepID=A0A8C3SGY2_CHESE
MNPFQSLPLYEKPVSEKYQNHDKGTLPPHIFAIADGAYQAMLGHLATGPQNQCIVISGESGAGKTESVKLLLRHIMHLCKGNSQLEQQILQQVDMQAILAGVLSLGNVTFQSQENNGAVRVSEASRGWLKAAAGQFGVQEEELLKCLICKVSVTRGEQIQRFHTQQQAEDARDSIAKVAYGRVFGWIVRKINELLAENVDPEVELREIGILDIFGFENFVVNRFEQLCINLANEQLQHFFNYDGLPSPPLGKGLISFFLLLLQDLFLAKPLGLLSLLDEQSTFPQATDKTFVDKLNSTFKGNSHFQPCRGRVLGFSIIHYAGKVQYGSSGFLEKNRDTLPANIRGLFINSVTPLLSVLFTATVSRTGTLMPHIKAKVRTMGSPGQPITGSWWHDSPIWDHSLSVLMERMYSANPHFVRCIKPNSQKEPGVVDSQVVLEQLRYNGLLETIRIRRNGFSWRPSFEEFAERFVKIMKYCLMKVGSESTELKDWRCGKSRLFFKYWHQELLAKSMGRLEKAAIIIQKTYKRFCCRKVYQELVVELRAREKHLQEEAERENIRQLELESQMITIVPSGLGISQSHTHLPFFSLSCFQSTPFDNFLHSRPCPVVGTEGQTGEEEEMRQIKRGATLRWFRETQARKVMQDDGAFPGWLHGMISTSLMQMLLLRKAWRGSEAQSSESVWFCRGESRCRHYMIEMQPNARYVILGEDRAHTSLTALVQYHRTVGIQPFMETVTVPCEQVGHAGATAVLKHMRFGKSKKCQEQQLRPDEEKAEPSPGEAGVARRAIPRLYPSIRLAMWEIQQVRRLAGSVHPPCIRWPPKQTLSVQSVCR